MALAAVAKIEQRQMVNGGRGRATGGWSWRKQGLPAAAVPIPSAVVGGAIDFDIPLQRPEHRIKLHGQHQAGAGADRIALPLAGFRRAQHGLRQLRMPHGPACRRHRHARLHPAHAGQAGRCRLHRSGCRAECQSSTRACCVAGRSSSKQVDLGDVARQGVGGRLPQCPQCRPAPIGAVVEEVGQRHRAGVAGRCGMRAAPSSICRWCPALRCAYSSSRSYSVVDSPPELLQTLGGRRRQRRGRHRQGDAQRCQCGHSGGRAITVICRNACRALPISPRSRLRRTRSA